MLKGGKAAAALELARGQVRRLPASAEAWVELGEALYHLRTYGQAVTAFARANAIAGDGRSTLDLAKALAADGRFLDAFSALRSVPSGFRHDARSLSILAQINTRAGRHGEALHLAQVAAALAPDSQTLVYNRALARRACGDIEGAVADLDEAIRRRPTDWTAWKNRSDLRRWTPADNHLEAIRSARPSIEHDPDGYILMSAAMAKELEDLGDHTAAFAALREGAEARRGQIDYRVRTDLERMDAIAAVFSSEWLSTETPSDTRNAPTPIFILGLPRSGSTLVERIVAASQLVSAGGEMPDFSRIMARMVKAGFGAELQRGERLVELAARLNPRELGDAYLASVTARGIATPYFTDKLPTNFLNIGLIHRALPHAKIVHVHRAPMDACFAIYKSFFGDAYPYSYDLVELADYYAAYRALMDHWHRCLPAGRILDIGYEDLVAHPARTGEWLFGNLGLGWSPDFLAVERSTVPTDTASAGQVARPIYRSSIDAWRSVSNQLTPLRERLAMHGLV